MSSSVLRNVIQPKAQTAPLEKTREETKDQRSSSQGSAELPKHESEDMELVLGVLVENAPVAMAMFDRGMRYILANRQWISEFGLQQVQPLVGKSQYEIFPGLPVRYNPAKATREVWAQKSTKLLKPTKKPSW